MRMSNKLCDYLDVLLEVRRTHSMALTACIPMENLVDILLNIDVDKRVFLTRNGRGEEDYEWTPVTKEALAKEGGTLAVMAWKSILENKMLEEIVGMTREKKREMACEVLSGFIRVVDLF